MKKIILLLLFIFNSFLCSAELLTYKKRNSTYSYCIDNYYFTNNYLVFKKSSSYYYEYERLNSLKNYDLKSGYVYKNNKCKLANKSTSDYETVVSNELTHNNLNILGLSNEQLNFMFALSGVITSFIFLFGIFRWI